MHLERASDGANNSIAGIASEWQLWAAWSHCTALCGKGLRMRSRACSAPDSGGNDTCPGNSTETQECNSAECAGNLLSQFIRLKSVSLRHNSSIHNYFQGLTALGSHGANGLSVRRPAEKGSKSGLEHAVNRLSEATRSALEIQQQPKTARRLSVQVVPFKAF